MRDMIAGGCYKLKCKQNTALGEVFTKFKVLTKLVRVITVAIQIESDDIDGNPRLRRTMPMPSSASRRAALGN